MNNKLVWVIIVVLVIYGAYLMMGTSQAPVVETPAVTDQVATTTDNTVSPVVDNTVVPAQAQ